YHSSFNNEFSNDPLTNNIRNHAKREDPGDIVADLAEAVQVRGMPREYKYAMLLEFGDQRIHDAVQENTHEKITPTTAYWLLQRVSHHDGYSRGRLKQAA